MELKLYQLVEDLQPQYSAFVAVTGGARSVVPCPGDTVLTFDLGRSLQAEQFLHELLSRREAGDITDISIERSGTQIEFVGSDAKSIKALSKKVLKKVGGLPPQEKAAVVSDHILIEDLTPHHSTLINRARKGAMSVPGDALLIMDVQPANMAGSFFNTLERQNPDVVLVDLDGRSGRVILTGPLDTLKEVAKG